MYKKTTLGLIICLLSCSLWAKGKAGIDLTLIPPATITNQVDLDIRVGITNYDISVRSLDVSLYLNKIDRNTLLYHSTCQVEKDNPLTIRYNMQTRDKVGKNKIILVVKDGTKKTIQTRDIEIIDSNIRSTRLIDGAWTSIYHWSETEGKHWNNDLRRMTDDQWREMIRSMHKVGMDIIVIQEVFRNEQYVGKHDITVETYQGKAFYPSDLYEGRMEIAAKDPVEAILAEADKHGMHVMMGVGMFAWFDFTPESLEWHKRVAKELWDKYGHHPSFYGFYVSEESGGGLDNWEKTPEKRQIRKNDIVNFFAEFKKFCNRMAPAKPIMLATNSMDVPNGKETYPELLKNLDILCPFGFARMPENDLTGKQAATMLQKLCNDAGSHLWFDLEAFLFNEDQSLYPRPIEQIIHDLNLFDNFEKILCYQFPGVFNDPKMSIRVGEKRTVDLFEGYQKYRERILYNRKAGIKNEIVSTKTVQGTWLNLPYQDVRNKYMNPFHVDCTAPAFWKQKIKEYSDIGLEYLVIMAVANERQAYYPSSFMKYAYPSNRQSPVEAIMEAADQYGMKVFMSCGWAVNQDDNIREPAIKELQQKIMKETADLFKEHKSFYGWYLPVEDMIAPYLSDHAIEAVNTLAESARNLTPQAQIMISPYGLYSADIRNPKFGEQIKKLKVDIIAYQDEVGCVREPMPMQRMKENFKLLNTIHKEAGIRFWANIESFTWEKETNSRNSALVPAAFPRYLSQLVGVSQAGVETVVSFSIYGIIDKPDSPMFIGQPIEAAKAYQNYTDWMAGKERWSFLETTFKGNIQHSAVDKQITYISRPHDTYNSGNLINGKLGVESTDDKEWVGFENKNMEIIIDLGRIQNINTLGARFLQHSVSSVNLPLNVSYLLSEDGEKYDWLSSIPMDINTNHLHDCWIDIAYADKISAQARYIKVIAEIRGNGWIFCDEVFVNP